MNPRAPEPSPDIFPSIEVRLEQVQKLAEEGGRIVHAAVARDAIAALVSAREQLAAARQERDDAQALAKTMGHEPSLSGDAIMEARAYLKEHLGEECACAFFDDCIHNAVAIALTAKSELATARAERDRTIESVNGAYGERNRLVALLARLFPSWVGFDASEPDWPVVFIQLSTGQVSWHVQRGEFVALGLGDLGSGAAWDGHDNDEKWSRVRALATGGQPPTDDALRCAEQAVIAAADKWAIGDGCACGIDFSHTTRDCPSEQIDNALFDAVLGWRDASRTGGQPPEETE